MPDWQAIAEKRLVSLTLPPQEKAEVIAELAAHLEDTYEALRKQGLPEAEAARRALLEAGNWQVLQRRILAAKRREQPMKTRVQQLWIPGFLTMIIAMVVLVVFQKLGLRSALVGNGSRTIFVDWSWLASLPFLGALAAYISSRAGGSRRTAALASIFPVLALTLAFLLMFPIGFALERLAGKQVDFGAVATFFLRDTMGWIVASGVAFLTGGLLTLFLLSVKSSQRRAAIG
jgi:hypothetical protein